MGGGQSKAKPSTDTVTTSATSTATAAPSSGPAPCPYWHDKQHLILAFFAGVLLTLLLTAFILLVVKSCRKGHSRPQALDPLAGPPVKHSSLSKESVTYASVTFQASEDKGGHLSGRCSADVGPVVYTEIKVASQHLPLPEKTAGAPLEPT